MWVGGRSGRCARRDPLRNVERPGTGAFEFIALTCTASAIAALNALTKAQFHWQDGCDRSAPLDLVVLGLGPPEQMHMGSTT